MTDASTARLVGNIVGGLLFLGVGYAIALFLQRRRGSQTLPKTPIVIGALLAAASATLTVTKTVTRQQKAEATEPMVVRQAVGDLTDADITPEYAAEVRDYIVTNMAPEMPEGVTVSGRTANVRIIGGRRIGVSRIAVNGDENFVTIFGIVGGEFVRVTCGVTRGRADYRSPECVTAVRQSLGVELP